MSAYVEDKAVEDEIRPLDIGIQDEREFFNFKLTQLGLSYIDDFDSGAYKIAGFSTFRHFDRIVFGRATYDILAFLGDVGGLEGITLLIGGSLISSITGFLVTAHMMPHLFYYRLKSKPEEVAQYQDLMTKL